MQQTPEQLLHAALDAHRRGLLQQAERLYRQILSIDPHHADALHLLGVVAHQTGHHNDAIALIERAIRLRPRAPDYHSNLGDVYVALGDREAAITHYRNAIAANPASLHAYNNLGVTLVALNRIGDAIATYHAALSVDPDHSRTHSNLGIAFFHVDRFDEAFHAFNRAVELDPTNYEAHANIGWLMQTRHLHESAIGAFARAIAIAPRHAVAHLNLGMSYLAQGRINDAISSLGTAASLRPDDRGAQSNILLAMHYDPQFSPATIFAAHKRWADGIPIGSAPKVTVSSHRVRVGYVSPDFRAHSVAHFIEPVLSAHDRTSFEIFCYSDVRSPDDTTARIAASVEHFVEVPTFTDVQLATRIRDDRIDILIDLAGHTAGNRLAVFAQRPAPVQATYLGYPNTTGLPGIQYRIVDSLSDPSGDAFHTEKLVRLSRCAWCYRPPDHAPQVSRLSMKSSGRVTFGSFNALPKISAVTIELWSRLLKLTPAGRLVIKSPALCDASARERLLQAFAAHDATADRLDLRGRDSSLNDHLQSYSGIDIALDTFPYHGTTTTCDALWMGVPVVTLAGDRHVERVGVSLLTAAGLPDLIATTPDEYVSAASNLASNVDRLSELRASLRSRMQSSPLTDGVSLARAIEAAYRDMLTGEIKHQRKSPAPAEDPSSS